MSFKEWIMQFLDENSPLGDLAEDIKDDKTFPDTNDKHSLIRYLKSRRACAEAIDAFKYAYKMYSGTYSGI